MVDRLKATEKLYFSSTEPPRPFIPALRQFSRALSIHHYFLKPRGTVSQWNFSLSWKRCLRGYCLQGSCPQTTGVSWEYNCGLEVGVDRGAGVNSLSPRQGICWLRVRIPLPTHYFFVGLDSIYGGLNESMPCFMTWFVRLTESFNKKTTRGPDQGWLSFPLCTAERHFASLSSQNPSFSAIVDN